MKPEDTIAEARIDEEVARRIPTMFITHVTGIGRRCNGVTIATEKKLHYGSMLSLIVLEAYKLDEKYGDVFPSDLKAYLYGIGYAGVAVCDHRDQFDHAAGRRKAKRAWLRSHPRQDEQDEITEVEEVVE